MKTNYRPIQLLTLALCLATLSSCSVTKAKGIAERAVVQFHDQLNAGRYHDIYVQTDEGFRRAASEADIVALFEAIHRKLGTVKNSTRMAWNVNATTSGTMVSLGYDVEFSEGKGSEQFVFHVTGDKALLFNYNINSPLLITK
jgi:hypothetical protein